MTQYEAIEKLTVYVSELPGRLADFDPAAEASRLRQLADACNAVGRGQPVDLTGEQAARVREAKLQAMIFKHAPERKIDERRSAQQLRLETAMAAEYESDMQRIIALVAAYCGVDAGEIPQMQRRSRSLASARALVCRLAHDRGASYPEIAAVLGTNAHATTCTAARRADAGALKAIQKHLDAMDSKPIAFRTAAGNSGLADDVKAAAAAYCGVTVAWAFRDGMKSKNASRVKMLVAGVLHSQGWNSPDIAIAIGCRDHATALYHIHKSAAFAEDVAKVRAMALPASAKPFQPLNPPVDPSASENVPECEPCQLAGVRE